jgi:plasmid stabilization system protein ParE
VDRFRPIVSGEGEKQEHAADEATAVLVKQLSFDPDVEKAKAELDQAHRSKKNSIMILMELISRIGRRLAALEEWARQTTTDLNQIELALVGRRGAAAALQRLEEIEERAHARLMRAIEAGNPFQVKAAQEFYLRASETLRRLIWPLKPNGAKAMSRCRSSWSNR